MKNNIKYILLAPAIGLTLAACQDNWNDHYDQQSDSKYATKSLYEALKEQPNLSDFCKVLDATRMFSNSKMTTVSYKDLLSGDQVFTIFAPENGSFNVDSLLSLCQTQNGDSLVEAQFLKNHIARYSHSSNGENNVITMLNEKYQTMDKGVMNGNIALVAGQYNLTTRNGIIHTIKSPFAFNYNIYEKLLYLPQYKQLGKFWNKYHIDEFMESSSLADGVDQDGKTQYIDSVFSTYSNLWYYFGYTHREDSSYLMIVPTEELWDSLYNDAKQYFDFSYLGQVKGDSLTEFYTHYGLLQDAVYNERQWDLNNDIHELATSLFFYIPDGDEPIRHYYRRPFKEGGIFNLPGTVTDTCSNGVIFNVKSWPFSNEELFRYQVKVEAEQDNNNSNWYLYDSGGSPDKKKEMTQKSVKSSADSISRGYLSLTPASAQDKYWVEYEIPSLLSGPYDIYAVVLPKSVDPNMDMSVAKNKRCNRFNVELTYLGRDNREYTWDVKTRGHIDTSKPGNFVENDDDDFLFDCNEDSQKNSRHFSNKPFEVDTVKLCTFNFPSCNWGQTRINTRLRINSAIEAKTVRTSCEIMFLDCLLFVPHTED